MRFIVLTVLLSMILGCSGGEKKEEATFNADQGSCKSTKICGAYEEAFKSCSANLGDTSCDQFLEYFKALGSDKTCSYKNKIQGGISGLSKCDEGRNYPEQVQIKAKNLINELMVLNDKARKYFISNEFRELLSGESAEAFKDKSIAVEKYYSGDVLAAEEVFTAGNISKLKKLLKEKLILENGWTLLISYLTVKVPRDQSGLREAIPNYDDVAEVIVHERDSFLIKLYMNFILATQGSADELRSYGLAKIYDVLPKQFLEILSTYEPSGRGILIKSAAWGMINIKHPIGKNKTEKDLQSIFPKDKSVYNQGYKHNLLVNQINKAILNLINNTERT